MGSVPFIFEGRKLQGVLVLKVRLNLISKKLKLSVKPRLADQTGLQSEHTPVLTQTDSPTVRSNPPEVKSPQLSLRVQFSSVDFLSPSPPDNHLVFTSLASQCYTREVDMIGPRYKSIFLP